MIAARLNANILFARHWRNPRRDQRRHSSPWNSELWASLQLSFLSPPLLIPSRQRPRWLDFTPEWHPRPDLHDLWSSAISIFIHLSMPVCVTSAPVPGPGPASTPVCLLLAQNRCYYLLRVEKTPLIKVVERSNNRSIGGDREK